MFSSKSSSGSDRGTGNLTNDQQPPLTANPSGSNRGSLVGSGLRVNGEIVTDEILHIEGSVEGKVTATVLTIGGQADVKADIIAEDIVVAGTVAGSIRADKVRLANTANVTGEIHHRLFAVEAGARFHGEVMHSDNPTGRAEAPETPTEWDEHEIEEGTAIDGAEEATEEDPEGREAGSPSW